MPVLSTSFINVFIYRKSRLCGFLLETNKIGLKIIWKFYILLSAIFGVFPYFHPWPPLELLSKSLFGAFTSLFSPLGSTVTLKNFRPYDMQKLPKNREFLAWDLFCNIEMVTRTGIELYFSHFLTCRDMGNSPYLRRFLTLTRFIMLSFILSFWNV